MVTSLILQNFLLKIFTNHVKNNLFASTVSILFAWLAMLFCDYGHGKTQR